jgi:HEAT repeat protein
MEPWLDSLFDRAARARTQRSYWRLVEDMQEIGSSEIFTRAITFLNSTDARRRRVAADVLGELGFDHSPRPFRERSIPALRAALRKEDDPSTLAAIVMALSRLNARSAIPSLVKFRNHASAEVRRALAAELPWCTWDTGEEVPDPRVTATLLMLSDDKAPAVRDWATYGLASSDVDTEHVRAALWRRTKDRSYDTRIEALRGLARRRDPTAHELLRKAVATSGDRGFGSWTIDDFVDYAKSVGDQSLAATLESWERVPKRGR